MGPLQNLLDDNAASQRNLTNSVLHWFCVPVIVWCVIGLLWCLPNSGVNWDILSMLAVLIYYAVLSIPLALGALPILAGMFWSVEQLAASGSSTFPGICVVLFVFAWIGQFIGHAIEGKRPSFFKDIQYLLIGPLWLLADL